MRTSTGVVSGSGKGTFRGVLRRSDRNIPQPTHAMASAATTAMIARSAEFNARAA